MNKKKLLLSIVILGLALVIFIGCGASEEADAVQDHDDDKKTLELSLFAAGYGEEVWLETIDLFKKAHPDVEVEVELSPENYEQLRLRYLDGNPPDFHYTSRMFLDVQTLIDNGQLTSLEDLMKSEAPDGNGTFEEMFIPEVLNDLRGGDDLYILPFGIGVMGLYYNETLFEENNWAVPTNFDEYLSMGERMKEKDIAPLTYPGVHPDYLGYTFLPTIASIGGQETMDSINNLEEGAWKQPAVIEALERLEILRDNGFIQDGALGFDHLQAQMEFATNRAGTVSTADWVYNEMEGNWEEGFELRFLGNPWRKAEEPHYIGYYFAEMAIPAEAKNPELGLEFAKFLYTDEVMQLWAETIGLLRPINNMEDYEETLPVPVQHGLGFLTDPDVTPIYISFTDEHKEVEDQLKDNLNALVEGIMTIDEFTNSMEDASRERRESRQ